jgi:beta-lactamase class A
MLRLAGCSVLASALLLALVAPLSAGASGMPGPLADLRLKLAAASIHAPGNIALEVDDLATGFGTSINANASMPAASTIKIPVMVEVFRQMAAGTFDLNTVLHVTSRDRDWGWGDLAGARSGTARTVAQLLRVMIEESDNTATNMLIRLVGRVHINATMTSLGLPRTRLGDDIRSDGDIRSLRTSPHDMARLLEAIARARLIDEWSSREMLAILTGQRHNGLIPAPLPKGMQIAHKTGTLHDTLNDVGIVYLADEPYVIAVMTTHLPSLSVGRRFIRHVSRLTFIAFERFARWREDEGLPAFSALSGLSTERPDENTQPLAPDVQMWTPQQTAPAADPAAGTPEPSPSPDATGSETGSPN